MDGMIASSGRDTGVVGRRARDISRVYFHGIGIDNIDGVTALKRIGSLLERRDGLPARRVVFVNVHSIHLARKDREFVRCINDADISLPDGSGLAIAGRVFRQPIRENLNGTDFTPRLLGLAEKRGWSVYLLGARQEVLDACHSRLAVLFPNLTVAGSHQGHYSAEEEGAILAQINRLQPDIVLVALGSPLQEEWMEKFAPLLKTGVCMGVGGLFDFISGDKGRAPRLFRRLGIEWVYRFVQDPVSKWERVFIEIPVFLLLVFRDRVVEIWKARGSDGTTQ